jgi:hypothetical protein
MNKKNRAKHMKFRKESTYEEPSIREVKLILLGVLIVGLMWFFVIPELTSTAQPLRFLDGIIPLAFAEDQNIVMPTEELNIQHTGTGALCPIITGPASATDVTPTAWTLRQADDGDAGGCWVSTFTNDRTTTPDSLLPSFFDDFLTEFGFIVDVISITGNPLDEDCKVYEVSGFGGDARLNVTDAYDLIQGRFANITDQIVDCDVGGGSPAGLDPEFYATPTFVYTDSMAINNTFFQVGLHSQADNRHTSIDRTMGLLVLPKFTFVNPLFTNNTVWMMQEHPKFPASDLDGGFFGIDGTTFTMDSNIGDDTQKGQVVIFKEFSKTNLLSFPNNSLAFYDQQDAIAGFSEPEGWVGSIARVTSGGSGSISVVTGKIGNALSYPDPNDNKVSQFDVPSADITTLLDGLGDGTGLSINYWAKHSDAAFPRNIVEIGNGVQSKLLRLTETFSSPNLNVLTSNLDGTDINNLHTIIIDDDNTFHMYSVTFNSTHYDVWRDGVIVASATHGVTGVSGAIDSHIGWGGGMVGAIPSNTNGCDCILDEVSIWNTTLGASEISTLYNSGDGLELGSDAIGKTDIRITGGYKAETAAGDMWVRMEVKDGSYGTQSLTSFPEFEYDIYQGGGSLGVIHLEPSDLAFTPFDVKFTPHWVDSTEDTFTVFIGVDDDSMAGSLIVNVTSVELAGEIIYDFDDINDFFFYEPSLDLSADLEARVGASDYNAGLVNITSASLVGFTPDQLGIPSAPTGLMTSSPSNTTVNLMWSHDLLNATDFKINRDGVKVGETNSLLIQDFNDTGLDPSTSYFYEVCALNGDVNGTCATASQETIMGDLPGFPENVVATLVGADVSIDWDDSANTLNYTVQRRNDTASEVTFTTIATGILVSDYLDTTVSAEHLFTYKIFSFNIFGNNTQDVADVPGQPDLDDLVAYFQFNNDDIVTTDLQSEADAIQNLGTLGSRQDASFFCNSPVGDCAGGHFIDPTEALVPGLFGQAGTNNGTASTQGSRWDIGNGTTRNDFKFIWANSITNLTSVNFWVKDPNSARLAGTGIVTPILTTDKFGKFAIRTTTGSAGLRIAIEALATDAYRIFSVTGPSMTADTDWHMLTMRINRENATTAWELCVDDGLSCFAMPPAPGFNDYVAPDSDPEQDASVTMSIGRDGCSAGGCSGREFITDELAFWDNTWLSDAERTFLYNMGVGVELVLGAGESISNQVLTNSPPEPPTNIIATAVDLDVFIEWDEGFNANNYTVQRRNDTASEVTFTTIATGIIPLNYTDTGVSEEHLFTYKIFSINDVGNSTQVVPAGQTFIDPYGYYKFDTQYVTTNGMGFRNLGSGGSEADGFMTKQTSSGALDFGVNVTASVEAGTMNATGLIGQAVITNDTGNNAEGITSTWVEFGTSSNKDQWHFLSEIDFGNDTTVVFWTNADLTSGDTSTNLLMTDSFADTPSSYTIWTANSDSPPAARAWLYANDFGATKVNKWNTSFGSPTLPTTGWHMVSVRVEMDQISGLEICRDGTASCTTFASVVAPPVWNNFTGPPTSGEPEYQLLLGPPSGFCETPASCLSPDDWLVDELSVFKGLLDDTEIDYLYNSGDGQGIITDEIDSISNQVLTNTAATVPGIVTGLNATATEEGIELEWNSAIDVTGYRIYRTSTESGDEIITYNEPGGLTPQSFPLTVNSGNWDGIAQNGDHFSGWTPGRWEGDIITSVQFGGSTGPVPTRCTSDQGLATGGFTTSSLFTNAMLGSNDNSTIANSTNIILPEDWANGTAFPAGFNPNYGYRGSDLINITFAQNNLLGIGISWWDGTSGSLRCDTRANVGEGGARRWDFPGPWSWTNSQDVLGIFRILNQTKLTADPEISDTGSTLTTFLDTDLALDTVADGHTYFYRLVGINAQGEGLGSNIANATDNVIPLGQITDLTATPINSIFLNWTDPGGPIDEYKISRVLGTEAISGDGDKDLLRLADFRGLNEAGTVDASDPYIQGQRIVLQHNASITHITSFLRLGGGGCGVTEAGGAFGIVLNATDGTVLGNSTNSGDDFCSWGSQSPNPIRFSFDPPVELLEGDDVVIGHQKTGKHTGVATDFHILAKMSTANAFTDNAIITGSPGGLVQDMNVTDGISFGAASAVADATHTIWYLGHEEIATVPVSATNFTDSTCPEGITCHYIVEPVDEFGEVGPISNRANATETIVDFTTDNNIWNSTSSVWQYREHDKGVFQPGLNFSNTDDSNNYLQIATWFHCDPPGSKCAGHTQSPFVPHPGGEETYIGNGLVFKTFKRTELENATITFDWKTTATGTQSGASAVVFDGPLHREDYTHWPTGFVSGIDVEFPQQDGIANRTLGTIDTTGTTSVDEILSVNMNSSIINWQDATHDLTTIIFTKFDSHSNSAQTMILRSVEIDTLGLWNFTNVQTLNTTGSLYALPNTSGFGSSMGGWNSTSSIINPNEDWGDGFQDSGLYNATLGLADGGGFTPYSLPTAPENLTATAVIGDVLVEWDEVIVIPNVTQYHVQRFLVGFSDDFLSYDSFPQTEGVNSLTEVSLWGKAFDGPTSGVQGFSCIDPDISLANLFPLNTNPLSTARGTPAGAGITPNGQSKDMCQDLNVTDIGRLHLNFTHKRGTVPFVGQIGQLDLPKSIDEFSVILLTRDAYGGGSEDFVGGGSFVAIQYNWFNGTQKEILWQTGRSAGTCSGGSEWTDRGAEYCNDDRLRSTGGFILRGINNNDLDELTGLPNSGATLFFQEVNIFQEIVASSQFGLANTVAQNVTQNFLNNFGTIEDYAEVESWDLYIGGSGTTTQTQSCPHDVAPAGQGPEDLCRAIGYVGVDMDILDVALFSGGVEQPQFADSFETIATLTPEEAESNEWLIREHRRAGNLEPRMGYWLSTTPLVVGGNNTLVMSQADTLGLHTDVPGTINGGGHIYKTFPLSFIEGKDITVEAQGYCGSGASCSGHGKISISINDGSWKDADQLGIFPLNDVLNASALGVGTFELELSVSATDPSAGIFNLTLIAPDLSSAVFDEVTIDLSNTDGSTSESAQHEIFRLIIGNVTTGITVYNFENADINYTDNEFIFEDVGTVNVLSVTGDTIPLSYLDTTVELGTSYAYRVIAENLVGNSTDNNFAQVRTNDIPFQVTNLQGEREFTDVDIDWEIAEDSGIGNPSSGLNLTKIQIFRSEDQGAFILAGENFPFSPPNNFFNDTVPQITSGYEYKVSGCNILGCGANATIFFAPPPLPPIVTATADLEDVIVEWIGNATTDSDYIIKKGNATAFGSWDLDTHVLPPSNDLNKQVSGIFLTPEGEYMFLWDNVVKQIQKYSLTTPFDVTTAVSVQNSTDLSSTLGSKVNSVTDQHWRSDGSTVVITDIANGDFYQYSTSSAWDLSTLAFLAESAVPPTDIRGIWIMDDGTRMFGMRLVSDDMRHWTFGTAWDITTITQIQSVATTPIGASGPVDVAVRPDGKMFHGLTIGGGGNDAIRQWNVTGDPFDITTLATIGGINVGQDFAVAPEPRGFFTPLSGEIIYVPDVVKQEIFMFQNNTDNIFPFGSSVGTLVELDRVSNSTGLWHLKEHSDFGPFTTNPGDFGFVIGPNNTLFMNSADTNGYGGQIGNRRGEAYVWKSFDKDELLGRDLIAEVQLVCQTPNNCGTAERTNFAVIDGDWENSTIRNIVLPDDDPDNFAGFGIGLIGFVQFNNADFPPQPILNLTLAIGDLDFTGSQDRVTLFVEHDDPSVSISAGTEVFRIILGNDTDSEQIVHNFNSPIIFGDPTINDPGCTPSCAGGLPKNEEGLVFATGFPLEFYIDEDVEKGVSIAYQVIALNGTTESLPGNATVLTNDFPGQVEGLTSNYTNPNDILVDWETVAFDGDGNPTTGMNIINYDIFFKNATAGETEFSFLNSTDGATTEFLHETDTFPDIIIYTVSACNEFGCGANSTEASSEFIDPPNATVNVVALAVNNTVALDWDDTPFAINYTLLRAETDASDLLFSDDFSTDNFSDIGTDVFVDTSLEQLNATADSDGTYHSTLLDLVGIANPNNWSLRYMIDIDSITARTSDLTRLYIGLFDSTADDDTVQDSISVLYDLDSGTGSFINPVLRQTTGATLEAGSGDSVFTVDLVATDTIYTEIKRTSSTSVEISFFTDNGFTNLIEKETLSITSGLDNLQYIGVKTADRTDATGIIQAIVDDLEFFNGTATGSFSIIAEGIPISEVSDDTVLTSINYTYGVSQIQL